MDLTGPGWGVREALGSTWTWSVDAPVGAAHNSVADAAARADAGTWAGSAVLPGRVPSSVGADLERAGQIPSPHRSRDSKLSEWVPARAWVYRRDLPAVAVGAADLALLRFDGVDPAATVLLDGRRVGRIEGMYRSGVFDVTTALRTPTPGPHRLAVVLDPVPALEPQVGRTENVRTHGPRLTAGWDFCPRLPHQGIWRPVRLDVGPIHLLEPAVGVLAEGGAEGRWAVEATGRVVARASAGVEVRVRLLAPPGPAAPPDPPGPSDQPGTIVGEARVRTAGDGTFAARIVVDRPRLWWPAGLGDQPRYDVEIAAGTARVRRRAGFRMVTWEANPGGPGGALPYTARVNGVRVPLVGWNWAPADARFGEIDAARLQHLLTPVASSGAQLLRVWGGGLVETDDFYDLTDELGLLVWQEFSLSSSGLQSAPATDPEYLALLAADAEVLIPARRHHPSLVAWGGGNELDLDGVPLDESRSPALAVLGAKVRALDPGRGWLPTSPTGPHFHNRMDVIERDPDGLHDVHGPWEHQGLVDHYRLANAGTCLAHTEFGVEGMAGARQWAALVPAAESWPVDRSNPTMRHLGEWWNNAAFVAESFGGCLADVEAYRRASHLLQATGLQYAVEADRRRAPRCAMVLPWQLAESFPNAWCTAVVDYLGDPKPAFHAVARAFAPERVTIRVERAAWAGAAEVCAQAWVWSDERAGGRPAGGRVELALRDAAGDVVVESAWPLPAVAAPIPVGRLRVPAGSLRAPGRSAMPADRPGAGGGVFWWAARWYDADGRLVDEEAQFLCLGADWSALLDLPAPALAVSAASVAGAGPAGASARWCVEVRNVGPVAAVGLAIRDARPADAAGTVCLTGDPRPLFPGEARSLAARWSPAAVGPELLLDDWTGTVRTAVRADSAGGLVVEHTPRPAEAGRADPGEVP